MDFERQEATGDWGGTAMLNSLLALRCLGYNAADPIGNGVCKQLIDLYRNANTYAALHFARLGYCLVMRSLVILAWHPTILPQFRGVVT